MQGQANLNVLAMIRRVQGAAQNFNHNDGLSRLSMGILTRAITDLADISQVNRDDAARFFRQSAKAGNLVMDGLGVDPDWFLSSLKKLDLLTVDGLAK